MFLVYVEIIMVRVKSVPHRLNDSVEFRWQMRNPRESLYESYTPAAQESSSPRRSVPFYCPLSPIKREDQLDSSIECLDDVDKSIELFPMRQTMSGLIVPCNCDYDITLDTARLQFLRQYGLMRRFITELADEYDPEEWASYTKLVVVFEKVLKRHSRGDQWQHFLAGFNSAYKREHGYSMTVNLEQEFEDPLNLTFEQASKFHSLSIPPASRKRKLKRAAIRVTEQVLSPPKTRLRVRRSSTKGKDE